MGAFDLPDIAQCLFPRPGGAIWAVACDRIADIHRSKDARDQGALFVHPFDCGKTATATFCEAFVKPGTLIVLPTIMIVNSAFERIRFRLKDSKQMA